MEDRYVQTERINITLEREFDNQSILDIGGGGEGFLGNLYGKQVIAIDRRIDELEETNNEAIKLVMDASDLAFTDNNFDVVTLFYSLMYMNQDIKEKVLAEAHRVLKPGGIIKIWDAEVPDYQNDGKDIFVAQLSVECNGKVTSTGYGVSIEGKKQSIDFLRQMLNRLAFENVSEEKEGSAFSLTYRK